MAELSNSGNVAIPDACRHERSRNVEITNRARASLSLSLSLSLSGANLHRWLCRVRDIASARVRVRVLHSGADTSCRSCHRVRSLFINRSFKFLSRLARTGQIGRGIPGGERERERERDIYDDSGHSSRAARSFLSPRARHFSFILLFYVTFAIAEASR